MVFVFVGFKEIFFNYLGSFGFVNIKLSVIVLEVLYIIVRI